MTAIYLVNIDQREGGGAVCRSHRESDRSNGHWTQWTVCLYTLTCWLLTRVTSKQTKKNFGSNRNKPKQDLFRFGFGLFRETKNTKFRFISVCFGVLNLYGKTNRTVLKQTETTLYFSKNSKICSLSNCFRWSSVCFDSIETAKLSVLI